ncbi:hypothetical protein J6590_011000 [Homalodisca vitripennis]|nr:hypothetical protein J6590_011000 [Homalodisca vitripennis]
MNGSAVLLTNKGRGDNSVDISTTTKYATETGWLTSLLVRGVQEHSLPHRSEVERASALLVQLLHDALCFLFAVSNYVMEKHNSKSVCVQQATKAVVLKHA